VLCLRGVDSDENCIDSDPIITDGATEREGVEANGFTIVW